MIQIWREGDRDVLTEHEMYSITSRPHPQFIMALTDNWLLSGTPVERGLDPVWFKLCEMDQYRDDKTCEEVQTQRTRKKELLMESRRKEYRAIAYDMRKEFAKVTNDINTSNLD